MKSFANGEQEVEEVTYTCPTWRPVGQMRDGDARPEQGRGRAAEADSDVEVGGAGGEEVRTNNG